MFAMSSPITAWDGAAEYFTFAGTPAMLYGILIASVVVTVLAVIAGAVHESEAYTKINGKK